MPPRKKVVRTVRKTKAKPSVTPPPTDTDTDVAPPNEVVEDAAIDTSVEGEPSVIQPAVTDTQAPADIANLDASPKASEPATVGTPVREPAALCTPVPEPTAEGTPLSELATTPETTENTPETCATPASEAPAAAADTIPDPSETAAKPATKTTIRVRKVVKKKIITKRVPKASAAAKEDEKVVHQPEPAALPVSLEKTPNELSELETPSSDAVAGEVRAQPEEIPKSATFESGTGEIAPVEQAKGEDVPMEQAKGEDVPMEQAKGEDVVPQAAEDEEAGISERRRRRKTEIFIGGLDRDAKEDDIRNVFGRVGQIVEVRMMMDGQTGKNKGYAFLRYAEASQAKKAVSEFVKVEVCGKLCGAAALEGNDTIFLGNIDKKWKKEDIMRLLQEIGIEKIDTVTIMTDPNNADTNRGFAFLELETNRDAQNAFKKLQKKDVFGKGRNIKVAWAEPLNDPDEEEMKKVKSVYAEGIPSSWDEEKVRESFKKFGDIERVVLARNIKSAKRKDFAFVNYRSREAALSCIESFNMEECSDNGSKVNVRVSLAKPVQKGKQNKGGSKSSNMDNMKEKPNAVQRDTKVDISSSKGKSFKGGHSATVDKKSSTTNELLHVLREQATWKQGQMGYTRGPGMQDYTHPVQGGKRAFSALGDDALYSDYRGYPRPRMDTSYPSAGSSYSTLPHGMAGSSSLPYYQHPSSGYGTGASYGAPNYTSTHQTRQGAPPHGSSFYSRY